MQRLMLQVLGSIAEFERELINARRREGIEAARAQGKQVGARRKLSDSDLNVIKSRIDAGETKKALAIEYQISRQTLYDSLARVG